MAGQPNAFKPNMSESVDETWSNALGYSNRSSPLDPTWPQDVAGPRLKAALTAPGAAVRDGDGDHPRRADAGLEERAALARLARAARARAHGERVFTIYEDERVTYDANYRAVAPSCPRKLQARWASPRATGSALAMRNLPEWPVIFFAGVSIGAIVVPLNAWWTAASSNMASSDPGAQLLFVDDERLSSG